MNPKPPPPMRPLPRFPRLHPGAATLLALVLAATLGTHAGAPPAAPSIPPVLTLDQALALAERHHPDLAEADALARAAQGRELQAGAPLNPEAIARIENTPFNASPSGQADYLAGVGITLPLGNRRREASQVETLDRRRLGHEQSARRLEVQRRVHAGFALALYQTEARAVREALAESAGQAVRLAQARVDAGDAIPADLSPLQAHLAEARQEQRRAEQLHRQALDTLALDLGVSPGDVRAVQGTVGAVFDLPALGELATALASHPALAAADADVAARDAGIAWSKALRIPDLKAEVLYHRIDSQKRDAFDAGISLPLPLFDRGRGRLLEATAQRDAAEARRRSTRAQLQGQLREAHAALTSALGELRVLETEVLPRAETLRRTAEARLAAGDLALAEVLGVRQDHGTARLRHLEAARDAMLAWARLRPFLQPAAPPP